MTRRYGWRAVLKAMKIEGMHKESEVEIKILPVSTLSKVKQASDRFVSTTWYVNWKNPNGVAYAQRDMDFC